MRWKICGPGQTILRRWIFPSTRKKWSGIWRQLAHFTTVSQDRVVHRHASGLLVVKRVLTSREQTSLGQATMELGSDKERGFRTSEKGRERMYLALDKYPQLLRTAFERSLRIAHETEDTVTPTIPTHVISLLYNSHTEVGSRGHIPWHQDNGGNDGEPGHPVVSLNIGDSAEFLVAWERPRVTKEHPISNPANLFANILLESGDALIFGGRSGEAEKARHIWHAVYKIHKNSAPRSAPFSGLRLNFTGRYTPTVNEEDYQTVSEEEIRKYKPGENPFYNLETMK